MSEELLRRVAALEAKAAVAETIYAYARAIRRMEPQAAADCYHEDGVFEIRLGIAGGESTPRVKLEGREAVYDYLATGEAAGAQLAPVIHNMVVRVDGTAAHASSVLVSHQIGGDRRTLAEYEDELRFEDGAWRLAHRVCTLLMPRT